MQETLYQTADAGVSVRQWMQETISDRMQDTVSDRMQESLYQTADTRVSISDSGCKSLYISDSVYKRPSIKQTMHESIYQTADAGISISDNGCKRLYQTGCKILYQTGCRSLNIRQPMQDYMYIRQRTQETVYQTSDAGVSLSDRGCKRLYIR